MKRNYYCLVAGLQDIALDTQKLTLGLAAFREELRMALHPSDFQLVHWLFLPIDHENLLNLLLRTGKPWLPHGNYDRETLEENIRMPFSLPEHMSTFLHAFKAKEPVHPNLSPRNELLALFHEAAAQAQSDFIVNWFTFERHLRNILTALGCRKHGLDPENQIIGSDDVAQAIRRSPARDFGLAGTVHALDLILTAARIDDLLEREKALDALRWQWLDEATVFEYFTIDRVLAFTIRLGLVERWLDIDRGYGQELFSKLLQELQQSYQLPETFGLRR